MNTTNATRAEAGNTTHPARLLQGWLAGNTTNGLFSRAAAMEYLTKTTGLSKTKVAGIVHRFTDTTSAFGIRKARTAPIKVRNYTPRRDRLSPTQAELVFFKGLADLKLNVPVVSYSLVRKATKLAPSTILRLLSTYAKRDLRGGRRAKWYLQSSADDRAKELGIHLPWMPEWLEPVDPIGLGAQGVDDRLYPRDHGTSPGAHATEPPVQQHRLDLNLSFDGQVLAPMLWLTGIAGGCAVLAVVAAAAAIYGVM